jgi:hypothetical protein
MPRLTLGSRKVHRQQLGVAVSEMQKVHVAEARQFVKRIGLARAPGQARIEGEAAAEAAASICRNSRRFIEDIGISKTKRAWPNDQARCRSWLTC